MGNERTVVHLELFVYDFKFLWLEGEIHAVV